MPAEHIFTTNFSHRRSDRRALPMLAFQGIAFGGLILLALLGRLVQKAFGLSQGTMLTTIAVVGGILLVLVVAWLLRLYRWTSEFRRAGPRAAPTDRLSLAGWPAQVDAIGPIEDAPFEPEIFAAPLAFKRRGSRFVWAFVILTVIFLVALTAAWWLLMGTFAGVSALHFFGALMMGGLGAAWLWPTYVRIVPGRLDVVRYPFLGRGGASVESFDLRTCKVLIDLRGMHVFLDTPSGPAVDFSTALFFGRRRLARALLRGAVCTFPAPELGEGELGG